jgi:SAM-dependent methyltransferase
LGLNDASRVIDFCCGYGEMLRLWGQAFASKGLGIELFESYVLDANKRMLDTGVNECVSIIQSDAKTYHDINKYDVVCLSGQDLFGSLNKNIEFMASYMKEGGKLLIGTPYYTEANVPQALIDFEGKLNTLDEIYKTFRNCGYNLTYFSTGNRESWESYISWSARRDIDALKLLEDEDEIQAKQEWIDLWYDMYFKYRSKYEAWGMFIIEKVIRS